MKKTSWVVAVSGTGRSLENLILKEPQYSYQITGVISSSPRCKAVDIAKKNHLPTFIGDFSKHTLVSDELKLWLNDIAPSWIVLAGFLKKFPSNFSNLSEISQRTINIHPSLLPQFGGPGMYGMNVHKKVYESQCKRTGATVHFVNEHYDQGTIIAQRSTRLRGDESPVDISKKVFEIECELLPEVLSQLSEKNSFYPKNLNENIQPEMKTL